MKHLRKTTTKHSHHMPTTHTFATLCARLNRAPVTIRGLQRHFGIPIPADTPTFASPRGLRSGSSQPISDNRSPLTDSPPAYFSFLETLVHLRALGIAEETLSNLWNLECKLMQILHADSTGSPTWMLDACGATGNRDRRLLLSNFDIGTHLSPDAVQLGLNFAQTAPDLFSAPEMGEDAILVLRQYITLHQKILHDIQKEHPIIRAALRHFPLPRRKSTKRRKQRHRKEPTNPTLIPDVI